MLADLIAETVRSGVAQARTVTRYRDPLIGFARVDDPGFRHLRATNPGHWLPADLLAGARSVVAYFVPFAPEVVEANSQRPLRVAREWALAYVETNALLVRLADSLIQRLAERGVRAAAEAPTHNFDPVSLASGWSHKSVAVIAGLGSFGLHQMVITDSGCAGRFGSVVTDAPLPIVEAVARQRCRYLDAGSCLECIHACPASALSVSGAMDKQACWTWLQQVAREFEALGTADVCGKCSTGPCALSSAV
jgi:epoxyqueuosine reductase QueG